VNQAIQVAVHQSLGAKMKISIVQNLKRLRCRKGVMGTPGTANLIAKNSLLRLVAPGWFSG
jgi:hypothetical protein